MQQAIYTARNAIYGLNFRTLTPKDLAKRGMLPFTVDSVFKNVEEGTKRDYYVAKKVYKILKTVKGLKLGKIENSTNPYDFTNNLFDFVQYKVGFELFWEPTEIDTLYATIPDYDKFYDTGVIDLSDFINANKTFKFKQAPYILARLHRMGFRYINDYQFFSGDVSFSDVFGCDIEEVFDDIPKSKAFKIEKQIMKEYRFQHDLSLWLEFICDKYVYEPIPKSKNDFLNKYCKILDYLVPWFKIENYNVEGFDNDDEGFVYHSQVFGFYFYRLKGTKAQKHYMDHMMSCIEAVYNSGYQLVLKHVVQISQEREITLESLKIENQIPVGYIHDVLVGFDFNNRNYGNDKKANYQNRVESVCRYFNIQE